MVSLKCSKNFNNLVKILSTTKKQEEKSLLKVLQENCSKNRP